MVNALHEIDVLMIAPIAKTSSTTVTANLDTRGADWATIRINFGVRLNTNAVGPTISLKESDDTVVTNFATIVADRSAESLGSTGKELRYDVDLRNRKRYLRISVTSATATNDDIVVGVIGTLSRLEQTPSNAAALVDTNSSAVIVTS